MNVEKEYVDCRDLNYRDIVSVNIHSAHITISHRAEVLSIPHSTGGSWKFLDLDTGKLHWISEPCSITLIDRGPWS